MKKGAGPNPSAWEVEWILGEEGDCDPLPESGTVIQVELGAEGTAVPPNDLKVESFVTSQGAALDGTVFAMANTVCENTCNEVSLTCNDDPVCGGESGAGCNWTTDQNAPSCTGDPGPGTIGCTGGGGGETEETCPETPESCEGMICEPG